MNDSTSRQRQRGNGQGGVYKRPDGRYQWQITLGRDQNGKQVRKTGMTRTKGEANRQLTELLAAKLKGQLALPQTVTLGSWLNHWLERRRARVAPSTFEQYQYRLRHVPAHLKRMQLQEIKRSHIRETDAQLLEKKLSSSLRSKVLSYLRSAFDEALEDEILMVNPASTVKAASTPETRRKRKRKALTLDELSAFLKAAECHPFSPLFFCLFSLGLRRGEALGLRWQDVDFNTGEVHVVQQVKVQANKALIGTLKTANSTRRLYAAPDLLDVLRGRQQEQKLERELCDSAWVDSGLIFTTAIGTAIHPRNVNRALYKICEQHRLPKFSSHSARHTLITTLLQAGEKLEVVSAIAGHANTSITLDIYREVLEEEKRAAVFSLRDRLNSRSPIKENSHE